MAKQYNDIMGNLTTTGDVIVYGDVMGNVTCSGKCVVRGDVMGDVDADKTGDSVVENRKEESYIDKALQRIKPKYERLKSTLSNSSIQINSNGSSVQISNGRIIASKDGIVSINGKKYKGSNVTTVNDKIYIDGTPIENLEEIEDEKKDT